MIVFFGPLCDVAGYAFATAAVIAPFSGFNIVTGCFVKTNRGRVANTVNYLATKVLSDHANCWVYLVINKHVGFFITERVCSTYDLGSNNYFPHLRTFLSTKRKVMVCFFHFLNGRMNSIQLILLVPWVPTTNRIAR